MGCADPCSMGVGASHQCPRVTQPQSERGKFVTHIFLALLRRCNKFVQMVWREHNPVVVLQRCDLQQPFPIHQDLRVPERLQRDSWARPDHLGMLLQDAQPFKHDLGVVPFWGLSRYLPVVPSNQTLPCNDGMPDHPGKQRVLVNVFEVAPFAERCSIEPKRCVPSFCNLKVK